MFFKFTAGGHGTEAKPSQLSNGVPLFLVNRSFLRLNNKLVDKVLNVQTDFWAPFNFP
jgi:hypothetical protein